MDKNSRVSKNSKIFEQGNIYVATRENTPIKDGNLDIKAVLRELYNKGIYTVFVECGGTLAGSMLKDGLIDEIYQFIGPKILNDNNGKSCFDGDNIEKISASKRLKIYSANLIENNVLIADYVQQYVQMMQY